jgi:hypothetical protein
MSVLTGPFGLEAKFRKLASQQMDSFCGSRVTQAFLYKGFVAVKLSCAERSIIILTSRAAKLPSDSVAKRQWFQAS